MANSRETFIDAVVVQLRDYSASVFRPAEVLRCFAPNEGWTPEPTQPCMYYVWQEASTTQFGPQSCEKTTGVQLVVRAFKRLTVASESPALQAPQRSEFQFELETDVIEAIYSDETFGGTARKIRDGVITDYQVQDAAYAAVDVRFVADVVTSRPGR